MPSDPVEEGIEEWLRAKFPQVCSKPFARRHLELWEWIEALEPGVRPRAYCPIWPRGGAKSSTVELGCARIATKLSRRFCLYVSATQEQADRHVQAIATLLENLGIARGVNVYGHSKGWRRNQLRTSNGFNLAALGLDTATRGIKLDEFRPDLIILDDVDAREDTPKTRAKKERTIASSILAAGSPDLAVLFAQNLIHEDSVASRVADGRAEILRDRIPPTIEPAVIGLKTEEVTREDGSRGWKIVAGKPTWEGQDLAVCEDQINTIGLTEFLREAQHEVKGASGFFFNAGRLSVIEKHRVPRLLRVVLAWDLAATEEGGDYTVWVLMGVSANGTIYVLDVFRKQIGPDKVEEELVRAAKAHTATYPRLRVRLPQDPAQAGKAQAVRMRKLLRSAGITNVEVKTISGKKSTRAKSAAVKVNSGNVRLVEGHWNYEFTEELRKFREDEEHEFDDQVDAFADGCNEICPARRASGGAVGGGPSHG